jgi:hypothetical protein
MPERRLPFSFWPCLVGLVACAGLAIAGFLSFRNAVATSRPPEDGAAQEPSDLGLDEEQRQFLWEVEHHGLLLSKHGFQPLADALARADAARLSTILAADFRGETLGQPREVRVERPYAQVVRQEYSGHLSVRLDRAQFLEQLLAYRRLFHAAPKVKIALMALAPEVREDLDGPWQGTGQLRMWGETTPGQPGEVVLYLRYRLPRPTEAVLSRPGWLEACSITQAQTARAPHFLMRQVAAERGLDTRWLHDNWQSEQTAQNTGGVYLCDFDRDGLLDLLVVDLNGYALYKGLPGGRFVDVTEQVGLPKTLERDPVIGILAGFADLDGDGWDDLILGGRIYQNEAGKQFTDVTPRCNLRFPGDANGFAVADFDRDGRLDLYVTHGGPGKAASWIDGKSGTSRGNQLWRNGGNWQFEDVTAKANAGGGQRSTFSVVWLDANNDGWPDLYVINEFGNGDLLLNQGDGTFREELLVDGPGDFGSMGVTCGDIDNDGNIDLYVANMYSKAGSRVIGNLKPGTYPDSIMATMRQFVAGSQLYRNLGGQERPRFERLGQKCQVASVGWAYGAALVDLDNDGFLDLYATAGFVSRSRSEPDG